MQRANPPRKKSRSRRAAEGCFGAAGAGNPLPRGRGGAKGPQEQGPTSHLPGAAHRLGVLHCRGQALAEGSLAPGHGRQPHLARLLVP